MRGGTYDELFGFLLESKNTVTLLTPNGRRWNVSTPVSVQQYAGNDVRLGGIRGPDATFYADRIEIAKGGRRRWPNSIFRFL